MDKSTFHFLSDGPQTFEIYETDGLLYATSLAKMLHIAIFVSQPINLSSWKIVIPSHFPFPKFKFYFHVKKLIDF